MTRLRNTLWMALLVASAASLLLSVPAAADQVILDDLIVDGSTCIGFDCVNGESFGFDTLRLKENNLRIKAQDTSSTASFPSNDWQITFNDSANGGANKFSIDDIDGGRTPFTIEAGAPSNSLYVDDGGRLGLGTSTPVVDVHIKSGNTPTLRLEQDGSSGFTPQTWDVAGNEANFFIRDATNGSTLPFRIFPGAPSNVINIAASGNVGIGTTSPAELLHLNLASGLELKLRLEQAATNVWAYSAVNSNPAKPDAFRISKQGSGGPEMELSERLDAGGISTMEIFGSVKATNVIFSSSREFKTGIAPVDGKQVLDRIAELPIARWRLKTEDSSTRHYGPMAEDFNEAFDLGGDGKSISMVDANGVALAAIQALAANNQELRERVEVLEARLSEKANRED